MSNSKSLKIVLITSMTAMSIFIFYQAFNQNTTEATFIENIRLADTNNNLAMLEDEQLTEIGKNICISSSSWVDQKDSIGKIYEIINVSANLDNEDNRLIPIFRFQSIYEICPENIEFLENIFNGN